MNHIDWNSRLLSIKGPKGVGKSTLMRQYIKLNYPLSIYFSNHTILDLAGDFVKIGGERLFIDEIHKYSISNILMKPNLSNQSVKKMQKPDKIFLDNTNILTAIADEGGENWN